MVAVSRAYARRNVMGEPMSPGWYKFNEANSERWLQPLNIATILKSIVDLPGYTLTSVHRALYPQSLLSNYHLAEVDVEAFVEIIEVIIQMTTHLGL